MVQSDGTLSSCGLCEAVLYVSIITGADKYVNQASMFGGNVFSDVTNKQWYKHTVTLAAENGFISRTSGNTFDFGGLATRAQAAQMLKNFLKNE